MLYGYATWICGLLYKKRIINNTELIRLHIFSFYKLSSAITDLTDLFIYKHIAIYLYK